MNKLYFRLATGLFAVGVIALSATVSPKIQSQAPAMNPEAVKRLRAMTDHMSNLKQFNVHVRNLREDLLESGHRVDFEISANLLVQRPHKLRAERVGHLVDQIFYYDGKTLTLFNPSDNVYATEPAAATIEEMLDFARESLDISMPVQDLVYRNAFPLLMQDVNLALVVGKETIGGVKCDHLLFSRPGVDFQVWVADSGPPLPIKYIVTDTGTPERLSITTIISDWNVNPGVADSQFTFVPPKGAKAITFMKKDASGESVR